MLLTIRKIWPWFQTVQGLTHWSLSHLEIEVTYHSLILLQNIDLATWI